MTLSSNADAVMTDEFDNGVNRVGPANAMYLPFLSRVLQRSTEHGSMLGHACQGPAKAEAEAEAETLGQIYSLTGAGS